MGNWMNAPHLPQLADKGVFESRLRATYLGYSQTGLFRTLAKVRLSRVRTRRHYVQSVSESLHILRLR